MNLIYFFQNLKNKIFYEEVCFFDKCVLDYNSQYTILCSNGSNTKNSLQTGIKKDNQYGILSKLDFTVTGLKGITGRIEIVLKNNQGKICFLTGRKFTPIYESSQYSDYKFFVPYDDLYKELHNFLGTLTLSVIIRKETDSKIIAYKDYSPNIYLNLLECTICLTNKGVCSFCSGTGKIVINYYMPPIICTSCYGSGACVYCNGKGYSISCCKVTELPVTPNINIGNGNFNNYNYREPDDRRQYNDGKITCPTCHGTGRCSFCGGRGEKLYNGLYYECEMCHGTGHCYGKCAGRGYFY